MLWTLEYTAEIVLFWLAKSELKSRGKIDELYAESKRLFSVRNLINLVLYGNIAILKSKLPDIPQEQIFWHCCVFQFKHC